MPFSSHTTYFLQFSILRTSSNTTLLSVPVKECMLPPIVPFGTPFLRNSIPYMGPLILKYPLGSQISYECLSGYEREGTDLLTCTQGGCWSPGIPRCADSGIAWDIVSLLCFYKEVLKNFDIGHVLFP